MTAAPPPTEAPVLAFIYDRHFTSAEAILNIRLQDCHTYAERCGWETAGEWLDRGADALTNDHRPLFDDLCAALAQAAAAGRRTVCLVQDWDRLSRDDQAKNLFARRIASAGGWIETVHGDTTGENSSATGRLSRAPMV